MFLIARLIVLNLILSSCVTSQNIASKMRPLSISHSNVASYENRAQQKETKCPQIDKIANNLKNPDNYASCSPYNPEMLKEITNIKPGGGYNIDGPPSNQSLCVGDSCTLNMSRSRRSSYCSGATYTAFINLAERAGAFRQMNPSQLENFKTDKRDNYGFWGLWNNNYGGVADANRYIKFGKNISSFSSACAGDIVKFSRKSYTYTYRAKVRNRKTGRTSYVTRTGKKGGGGHSVVFLGYEDGLVYYWSSNKTTGGYGITCEAASKIEKTNIVRVTNPENLANVRPYSKQNMLGSLPSVDQNERLVDNKDNGKKREPASLNDPIRHI